MNKRITKPSSIERYIYRLMPMDDIFPALRACLAPMGRRSAPMTRSIRQLTLDQIEQRFGPAVDPALLQQKSSKDYSRDRIFPMARTFWCWIWQILQANTSCREVVRQVQALFGLHERQDVDEGSSAYCQARGKLSMGLLQKIFAGSARRAQERAPVSSLLQGRDILLADGSGMRLPDTSKNRAAFPPPKNQPVGTGFPYMKVVLLFALNSGAILAHTVGSLLQSELRLFLCLRSRLKPGQILVLDRAYGFFVVAGLLQLLGVDLVARVPTGNRKIDFRQARKKLGANDALFIWEKPRRRSPLLRLAEWTALPSQLTLRIVRVRINKQGFRIRELTVVTSLLDPILYPAQEILEAYLKRWRMEMCLDDLKTTMDMEYLSCLSPKMAHKELLIFLTAHNFLRWIMAEAAQTNGVELERISFKGCMDGFRQFSKALARIAGTRHAAQKRDRLWRQFSLSLARDLVPERPGRREPRAVKRKRKYDDLNRSRRLWKDRPGRHEREAISRKKNYGI
jgi:hypothetical protein